MAQLLKTEITGSLTDTGSLIISGSQPVQLPALTSGSGDVNPELITNQFWFDQGDNTIKYSTIGSYGVGVWSVGGRLNEGRGGIGSFGAQNAALAAGGYTPSNVACVEEYNGSSWSVGTVLSNARHGLRGAGSQNAGVAFFGRTPSAVSCTEEYDGTSWANGGAGIQARAFLGGAGVQNAAIAVGGSTPTVVNCTEEYNGTSWSAGNGLITAGSNNTSDGTQNATVATLGSAPGYSNKTELYDGAAWSVGGVTINSARQQGNSTGGCQNATIIFGGDLAGTPSTITEEFDGTSWSAANSMITARDQLGSGGSFFAGLAIGGTVPGGVEALTEEFTRPFLQPFSCNLPDSVGVWSAGGALITGKSGMAGAGTQTAGLGFGGYTASATPTAQTEEYNGTAWSAGGALILARNWLGGAGTQTAGLGFGGSTASSNCIASATEEYNGTAWTNGGNMNTARRLMSTAGSQNAAASFGGYVSGTNTAATEEYNGSTWQNGGNMSIARRAGQGGGTQNAAVGFGGYSNSNQAATEEYNGTSWATGGAMITARVELAGAGASQDASYAAGGYPGGNNLTEHYNGISWSAQNTMIQARYSVAGTGTTQASLVFGGSDNYLNFTEEFTIVEGACICTNTYRCNLPTVSVWNTGGNLSTAFYGGVQVGTPTAALAMGGYNQAPIGFLNCTQNYNGTSWGQTGALINNRAWAGASGTQNAAVLFGGTRYPNQCNATEEFNGSAWSAGNVSPAPASFAGSSATGTQNAALQFGGNNPTTTSCTIAYDGTNWSARNNMITGNMGHGTGTQNSAIKIGRRVVNTFTSITEEYDGSTWSTADPATINQGPGNQAGVADAALYFGGAIGNPGQYLASTQFYNGVSWATKASLSVGRYNGGGSTRSTSGDNAMFAGGNSGFPNIYQGSFCTENYTETDGESVFFNRDTCVRCITGTCTQIS